MRYTVRSGTGDGHARRVRLKLAAAAFVLLWVAGLEAAELTDAASRAFADYAERARAAFVDRVTSVSSTNGAAGNRPDDGRAIARAGSGDGIVPAPDSLIHHWFAATWIPGVTLDQAIGVSRRYSEYPQMYKAVIRAAVMSMSDDTVRLQLRLRESAGGLSATLDVRSTVVYARAGESQMYAISTADEIREVKTDAAGERLLPPGRDSGYLWRAASFTRFVQESGGVYVEMETLGLSRPFPRMLGWVIEPIARRIGRRSAENSVLEFRTAVLRRHQPD